MIVICIGPVCIPAHMLLAAFLGFLHSYGLLTWIKTEWVTYRYWKYKWQDWRSGKNKKQPHTGSNNTAGGNNAPQQPVALPSDGQPGDGQQIELTEVSSKVAGTQQGPAAGSDGQPRTRATAAAKTS